MIESPPYRGGASFWRALSIQLRVIHAVLMREILTRHGRKNIGFLWIVVEPMMFTLGVLAIRTGSNETFKGGVPAVAFIVTGYATVLAWRNIIGHAGESVRSNRPLMFHRNVRVGDLFVARLLLEAAGASMSFIVLCTFFVFIGIMRFPYDLLKIIAGWLMLVWFSMGMGLIVGSATIFSETWGRLWHVFAYLFLGLSGAFYMVQWLPSRYQPWALAIPTVHCTELIRDGYFGPFVRTRYSLAYITQVNVCLMLLGLNLARRATKRLEDGAV